MAKFILTGRRMRTLRCRWKPIFFFCFLAKYICNTRIYIIVYLFMCWSEIYIIFVFRVYMFKSAFWFFHLTVCVYSIIHTPYISATFSCLCFIYLQRFMDHICHSWPHLPHSSIYVLFCFPCYVVIFIFVANSPVNNEFIIYIVSDYQSTLMNYAHKSGDMLRKFFFFKVYFFIF